MTWRVLATARHFGVTPDPTLFLQENGCEVVPTDFGGAQNDALLRVDALKSLLSDVDACIIAAVKVPREVIAACPRLKVIARRGVGYDSVDVQAATDHGVLVSITPGTVDDAVAEHAITLILATARRIVPGHTGIQTGIWQAQLGVELWGKRLGIVGMGRIGKAVVRRAAGFEMPVLAYDMVQDREFAERYGVTYVPLDELMERSDFISVNAPYSPATHHLVGEAQIARMKPTAILVNTARGPLVDEQALIRALQAGRIGGAGLDVFEQEPPAQTPLAHMPNVVVSPHTGGYTVDGMARANLLAAQIVVRLMHGEQPAGALVNPAAWETWRRRCGL